MLALSKIHQDFIDLSSTNDHLAELLGDISPARILSKMATVIDRTSMVVSDEAAGCQRAWWVACPRSWFLSGDGESCLPPPFYDGRCTSGMTVPSTPEEKFDFSVHCRTQWPCETECEALGKRSDWSSPAPYNWTKGLDEYYHAPDTYKGPCITQIDLSDHTDFMKMLWANNCDSPWPCEEETRSPSQTISTSLCMEGWKVMPAPSPGSAPQCYIPPEIYLGPCHPLQPMPSSDQEQERRTKTCGQSIFSGWNSLNETDFYSDSATIIENTSFSLSFKLCTRPGEVPNPCPDGWYQDRFLRPDGQETFYCADMNGEGKRCSHSWLIRPNEWSDAMRRALIEECILESRNVDKDTIRTHWGCHPSESSSPRSYTPSNGPWAKIWLGEEDQNKSISTSIDDIDPFSSPPVTPQGLLLPIGAPIPDRTATSNDVRRHHTLVTSHRHTKFKVDTIPAINPKSSDQILSDVLRSDIDVVRADSLMVSALKAIKQTYWFDPARGPSGIDNDTYKAISALLDSEITSIEKGMKSQVPRDEQLSVDMLEKLSFIQIPPSNLKEKTALTVDDFEQFTLHRAHLDALDYTLISSTTPSKPPVVPLPPPTDDAESWTIFRRTYHHYTDGNHSKGPSSNLIGLSCTQDFNRPCPQDWLLEPESNLCRGQFPPGSAEWPHSPCGLEEPFPSLNPLQRSHLGSSCRLKWPCMECEQDFVNALCPLNWTYEPGSGNCSPSQADHQSPCSSPIDFTYWTPELRRIWTHQICRGTVTWPCLDSLIDMWRLEVPSKASSPLDGSESAVPLEAPVTLCRQNIEGLPCPEGYELISNEEKMNQCARKNDDSDWIEVPMDLGPRLGFAKKHGQDYSWGCLPMCSVDWSSPCPYGYDTTGALGGCTLMSFYTPKRVQDRYHDPGFGITCSPVLSAFFSLTDKIQYSLACQTPWPCRDDDSKIIAMCDQNFLFYECPSGFYPDPLEQRRIRCRRSDEQSKADREGTATNACPDDDAFIVDDRYRISSEERTKVQDVPFDSLFGMPEVFMDPSDFELSADVVIAQLLIKHERVRECHTPWPCKYRIAEATSN